MHLARLLRLRNEDFDIIFAFQPSPITVGLPSSVLRYTKKIPVVFWVQDLWPDTPQALGVIKSKLSAKIIEGLVRFVYKNCDFILVQSKSFIPNIEKYLDKFTPIEYMPNWPEIFFDFTKKPLAKEVPLLSGSFDIMFAGNIGEAQDFEAILSAAEILKLDSKIRWIIVGDGRMANWVKREIKSRKLENCFLMLGRHPVESMPSFFKHAKVLLVSLKNDPVFSLTIPGKIQTYLLSGIPIIAMINGEGSRVVQESKSGFSCPAGDYRALANLVLKLKEMNNDERKKMGKNGILFSRKEFNRNRLIDNLEKIFTKIAGSNI